MRSASGPSANLAPRLDREGQQFPWVRIHFITSLRRDKGRASHVERVAAYSRIANSGSSRLDRRAATAAVTVRQRRGAGGASRRAGVTGPALTGVCGVVSRTGVIGNVGANERRCRRQLTRPRRARVSAQLWSTRIFANACVIGRAVMPRFR